MTKYRVYVVAVASTSVEVEAEDGEQAIEEAFNQPLPYASINDGFDLGDWALPSELFPRWNSPEDDYEVLDD